MNTNAIVSSDGHVLWMFPAVINTYCTLDVRHFPFDEQKCELIFISWTYNGHKLNVTYNASEHQAIYYRPKVGGLLSTLSKPHTLPSKILRYRRKRTLRTQDTGTKTFRHWCRSDCIVRHSVETSLIHKRTRILIFLTDALRVKETSEKNLSCDL